MTEWLNQLPTELKIILVDKPKDVTYLNISNSKNLELNELKSTLKKSPDLLADLLAIESIDSYKNLVSLPNIPVIATMQTHTGIQPQEVLKKANIHIELENIISLD